MEQVVEVDFPAGLGVGGQREIFAGLLPGHTDLDPTTIPPPTPTVHRHADQELHLLGDLGTARHGRILPSRPRTARVDCGIATQRVEHDLQLLEGPEG
jgi:hypothetical protein